MNKEKLKEARKLVEDELNETVKIMAGDIQSPEAVEVINRVHECFAREPDGQCSLAELRLVIKTLEMFGGYYYRIGDQTSFGQALEDYLFQVKMAYTAKKLEEKV